jgi:hypothetical protein
MDHGNETEDRLERQVRTAAAFLDEVKDHELKAVVFNKALFYADLAALRDLGRTLTGSSYTAAPLGPMLTNFKVLVKELEDRGIAKQVEDGDARPIRAVRRFNPRLPTEEAVIVRRISAAASDWTSTGVSDLSHENIGWILGRNAPNKRINLIIAMQQIVDHDPWLDAPLTEEESEAVSRGMTDLEAWH